MHKYFFTGLSWARTIDPLIKREGESLHNQCHPIVIGMIVRELLDECKLTDQIMREYWIAVPNADKSPKRPHTRIIRMRNITLGQVVLKIGKCKIKIFDRERAVVDAFRYLSHEIAIKALQAYLKPSINLKPNLVKLSAYAKALRVNITPYIMALTTWALFTFAGIFPTQQMQFCESLCCF